MIYLGGGFYMSRCVNFAEKKIYEFIREGRGQGEGADYKHCLKIHDVTYKSDLEKPPFVKHTFEEQYWAKRSIRWDTAIYESVTIVFIYKITINQNDIIRVKIEISR